jgi:hypothetical protein
MHRSTLAALVAAALLAALAAPARAADLVTPIDGTPLTVYVGQRGQLQALRAGESDGFFFRSTSQVGDAGFFLAFPGGSQPAALAGKVFGFDGTAGPRVPPLVAYAPVAQQPVTGSGTAASPFQQVTTYNVTPVATPLLTVTQTTTYVNGAQEFGVTWAVKNASGQALRFKALAAADFFFEGSDRGTGIFTQGPPRFVGGTNADTGRSGGFVEVASAVWTHYQALEFGGFGGSPAVPDIWNDKVEHAGDAVAATFEDEIEGTPTDNAGGVEWDDTLAGTALANQATATYALTVRSALPAALQFDKSNAGAPQGTPITFVATAKDTSGQPFTGKPLRFTISGPNAVAGAVTIDASGNGAITDPGAQAGADTIVAFVDLNGNGSREPNEPQASTLATFVDNVPPSCAVKVSGDRPGGGGAGKPLVITVNCDSPATVTTQSSFTITPKKRAAAAAKPRKVVIKLPKAAAQVLLPGKPLAVSIKVPKKIAKKYAGAKVVAKVVVTATDAAGNKATKTASRTLKLRSVKRKRR